MFLKYKGGRKVLTFSSIVGLFGYLISFKQGESNYVKLELLRTHILEVIITIVKSGGPQTNKYRV